jgi:sugar transferase (PEP-CTERM/EpsH1 system associated)
VKILFVVPYVPNLIRVRPFNLIVYLAALGHEITLATLFSSEEEKGDLECLRKYCKAIYAFELTRAESLTNSLLAVPSSLPLQSVFCWQPELAKCILELTKQPGSFDVVHIEHLRGVKYGLALKARKSTLNHGNKPSSLPIVWDSVDCISMLFSQAAGQSKKRLSRWLTRFELTRTGRYEGWLVNQFNRVLVTSKNDRNALMKLASEGTSDSQIKVLPNGVDVNYFNPPNNEITKDLASLVISGKMSYHANVTMSLKFIEETMPIIWSQRPDVKLVLVGKDPAPELRELARNPSIEVTGTVKDIRPYLYKATVAVTPITYGAGIQNKVLEAMACGLPVVSSPQAVSALEVKPGEDLIVANGSEEFANAVVALLDDSILRSKLGKAGRKYVEKQHLWVNIAAQLEEVYHEAIKNSRDSNG